MKRPTKPKKKLEEITLAENIYFEGDVDVVIARLSEFKGMNAKIVDCSWDGGNNYPTEYEIIQKGERSEKELAAAMQEYEKKMDEWRRYKIAQLQKDLEKK